MSHTAARIRVGQRTLLVLAWLLVASLPGAVRANAAPPAKPEVLVPSDFAYGRSLELTSNAALQTVLLDRAVYAGSVGRDLSDLRVFNGEGEQIPHALRSLTRPSSQETVPRLPIFTLDTGILPNPLDPSKLTGTTGWGVDAEVSETGAVIKVRPHPQRADESAAARLAGTQPNAYLVDASQLRRPIVRLDLELADEEEDFMALMQVEGSHDLSHFEILQSRAALASLDQQGHRIVRSSIDLPANEFDYLRLTWQTPTPPARITSVQAHLRVEPGPAPRHHATLPGRPLPNEAGRYLFDLGGAIPIDRVQVSLPADNSLVQVQLLGASRAEGPFVPYHSGLIYRFQQHPLLDQGRPEALSGEIRNREIHWPDVRTRFIELVVDQQGGGIPSGEPELEIAWRPHQLLFVTRGPGPYQLAYGRADVRPSEFGAERLLRITRTKKQDLPTASARLGPPKRLGDPSVLEPIPKTIAPRTVVLWIFLIAVVLAVAGMSLRLLRDLR